MDSRTRSPTAHGPGAKIAGRAGRATRKTPGKPLRALTDILLEQDSLAAETRGVAQATVLQSALDEAGALLLGGFVGEAAMLDAQAAQHRTRRIDLGADPADVTLSGLLCAEDAVALSAVPWRRMSGRLVAATDHPERLDDLRAVLPGEDVVPGIAPRGAVTEEITRLYGPAMARAAEMRAPRETSCRVWSAATLARFTLLAALALLTLEVLSPALATGAVFGLAATVFCGNVALKLASAAALRFWPEPSAARPAVPEESHRAAPGQQLPVISILVPLFNEKDIAGHLVRRIRALDYPRDRLDVILILEADDHTTRAALEAADLPRWIRAITVPEGRPRTKPRALNYALPFTRGTIVGIYDAEDRPERGQLHKVVTHFASAPPDVACLQGRLDYYNPDHNWLSRCFTIEYATWFRLLLPGVARLGLFVPLGGTTVFIDKRALIEVGAWDAHNVTEDAELGLRLARAGYRTEIVDTTTYEEANSALWPWVRQRSRWLKGYAITWATAMRAPRRLWRDLGPRRFWGLQIQLAGACLGFFTAPLLWSLVALPLGLPHPLSGLFLPAGLAGLSVVFLAALALSLTLNFAACRAAHLRRLRWSLPLMLVYFPLASLAAFVAVFDLMARPFHWAKTEHGRYGGHCDESEGA